MKKIYTLMIGYMYLDAKLSAVWTGEQIDGILQRILDKHPYLEFLTSDHSLMSLTPFSFPSHDSYMQNLSSSSFFSLILK